MIQVITPGHPLSDRSHQFAKALDKKGAIKVFRAPLHISTFNKALEEMTQWFNGLKAAGCDLTGHTRTLIVPSGSSLASCVMVTAWYARTGDFPEILNLIRRGPNNYVPSPEAPILGLDDWAMEQMKEEPELLPLHSIKSSIRKQRAQSRVNNEIVVTTEGVHNEACPFLESQRT